VRPDHALCGEHQCTYEVRDSYKAHAHGSIATSVISIPHAKSAQFETIKGKDLEGSLVCLAEGGVAPYVFEKVDERNTRANTIIHQDGRFNFYPDQKTQGKDSFRYRFIDSNGHVSYPATIVIMVHALPHIEDAQFSTYINTPVKGALCDKIVTGAAPYSFALVGSPSNGIVALDERGIFTFYPNKDFKGVGSFQYQIQDCHKGISVAATATIIVCETIVTKPLTLTTKENMPIHFDLTSLVDGGQPPYIFTLKGRHAGLQVQENGSLTYTPETGFHGSLTSEYQVTDAYKNISTNQIIINIKEKPYLSAHTFEIIQNQTLKDTLQVLVNKGAPPYRFELIKVKNGILILQEDGLFTFNPIDNFKGECSFWYRVHDACGNVSRPACVTIRVAPFLPVKDSTCTTFVNTPISGVLKKPSHKDAASCTFECVQPSSCGTLDLKPDGAFTFMPNKDFSGTDQFKFRIMNKNGAMSDSATMHIMVVEKPPLPIITQEQAQQAYQFLNSFLKQ
jgi:hypothetical protein